MGWWYVWNGENRMVLVSNAQHVVTYAYDHQGRMVAKTVDDVARQYIWDGYDIVQALTHSPTLTLTNSYVWGLDLSGTLQGAGGIGGLLAGFKRLMGGLGAPRHFTYAYDANGNVVQEVRRLGGNILAHYDYDPFGNTIVATGVDATENPFRFSTKLWCPVTGLSEYEFRKYGPGMGRWLSRDPIGEEGGLNLLAFNLNSPVIRVDYFGLISKVDIGRDIIDLISFCCGKGFSAGC